jgi:polyferredoxin
MNIRDRLQALPPMTFRYLLQGGYLLFFCWLGWRFYRWAFIVQTTGSEPFARPAAVDGFLPIGGLAGLRFWVETGQLHPVHPAAALILLAALLTGLLLKRGFCSWICPVFTLSEQLWRLGARLCGRTFAPPFWLDLLLRSLKYLLLFFFLFQIVILMPLAGLDRFLASAYHQTADFSMLRFFMTPGVVALTFFSVFSLLALFVQNPWCRYLCPYGALLGLVSLCSVSRIRRSPQHCVRCGACSSHCPAWLPVMLLKSVRSPECFACYRCVQGCPAPDAGDFRPHSLPDCCCCFSSASPSTAAASTAGRDRCPSKRSAACRRLDGAQIL